ncbi:FtsX-like permease family protein [Nonomuraea sp. NPDC046802]|uniref:FtsX-like permease family protein n=1 Tax=Nonomuraea sp. NPDC046802 TaxID=3154919 RepID=UPI0033DCBE9A
MRVALLARVHLGTVGVLFSLTLVACLLVAGLPRAMQGAFDDALRRSLATASAAQADLTVTMVPQSRDAKLMRERGQFDALDRQWRNLTPPALRSVLAGSGHMSAKTSLTPVTGTGGKRYINLGWVSDADRRVDWVRGRAPGDPGTTRYKGQTIPLLEVGVVEEALSEMGLRIGQTTTLGESDFAAVKIVGAFRAKDPGDRSWHHNADLLHVRRILPQGALDFEYHITTLTSDAGLSALSSGGRNVTYRWILPIAAGAANALDVPAVKTAIADFERVAAVQPARGALETGLTKLLDDFLAALASAQTVMYLVLGGLLAVAIGVIVLTARLLTDRVDHTLALARARGGSLRQVAGAAAALTTLAVAPSAVAGYAMSFLVPGPVLPIVHVGPVLVVVAGVGFTAARTALAHRTPLHERRDDVASARPTARRITLEALVIVLALAGAYLLRARGLDATAGQDPFLLLVPIALTLAAALITLRCYPYPLRLFVRLAARGRAAVPFLGLTRAARARSANVLPVLILLPALGVSVFAAVISDGIAGTQRLASWQRVGAPVKVTSEAEIPAAAIARVRAMAGVEQVVPAQTGRVQVGYSSERAEAIAVDVAQWRQVLAGSPVSLPALRDGAALVSPELRGRGTIDVGWQSRMKLGTQGVIESVPGFHDKGKFMIVPLSALVRPTVNVLLIKGDVSLDALARLLPSATLESQEGALAAIRDDPLTSAVRWTLLVVTVALAGYALVAVVLSLVIGAADRAVAVSYLRALGLSDRQAQRLTVLEILPMILITALVGLGLGLGLPSALGPGVDLSSYSGDLPVGDYSLDLLTPSALAAGLSAAAVLGAYAHTAISRRRSLGAVLRVGDLS